MKTQRPTLLIITSFLLILATLLFWGIVLLPEDGGDSVPAIVLYASVILGVLGLVAAAGVFIVKRWGMWLAVVVSVFAIFFAISGVVFSYAMLMKGLCTVLTALYVVVIVLAVLPSARQSSVARPALTDEKAN
ncbi:hypothetical protein KSF_009780 [Reticulibacter mediterranei]|uniref:Uncharacterized protein n=1 Tax=Reticulibacter mediterranei TaxID=2778369 RepID=A0A8J3IHN3_9CHLR|nr:hypothetical protein [Reticulibacter mediterranei]GHO90930.1 hypothetical protein KSF_009780 [Reticulibacter mediterranei]